MSELTTNIIVAVIAGFAGNIPWLIRVTTRLYKDKHNVIVRQKRVIFAIIRYILIALAILGVYLFVEFDRNFVILMVCLVLLCSYFIASDVLYFSLFFVTRLTKREKLEEDRETWLHQLGMRDPKNKDEIEKVINKIKDIERKLKTGDYD